MGFTSLTLNPPAYLSYLLSRIHQPIERKRLSSLSEAYKYAPLVINATGLGSYSLINDTTIFPAMGQTVTVRAPLVEEYIGCKDPRKDGAATVGEQIYIIPRPASGGLVTLGGCFRPGDWCAHPDPARAERILKEAYELCPLLGGGEYRPDGWRDTQVVSHNAGLRPCRKDGARVELEKVGKGHIVHAYGLGSSGYQWSYGVAQNVKNIVLHHLHKANL